MRKRGKAEKWEKKPGNEEEVLIRQNSKKSFEGTSGISALVDSSNITVNLIKYIVIPKEASLISQI